MAVVDKNKLLGKSEKGGDLMASPTTSLVGSSGGKITKTSDEKDVLYTISTKLVKVDKFLKGTLAADKVAQKKEQKQKEDQLRAEQEKDKEKPKDDKKDKKETPKSLIPKLSFLDGIKKFLGDVVMGWLVFRLIKFLPKIVSFLKPAAAFVDWILKWGGKLLDGLITLVDWGYKAVEGTRSLIGNLFGEKGVEAFDGITGTLNKVFNLIAAIGLAAVAFTNEWNNQDDPDDPNNRRNRLKDEKRQQRLEDAEYKKKFDERVKRNRQYKRQQFIDKWKKRLGIDQPKVQGPKQPNLFERIQRSVTPDTPSTPKQPNLFERIQKSVSPDTPVVKKPGIGKRIGNWWESGAAGRKRFGSQITNLRKRGTQIATDLSEGFNKNISKPVGEFLENINPNQWLKKLAEAGDDVVGSRGARRLLDLMGSPVLKKWLGKAPLIGDAVIFISDILNDVHWARALMRTATAFAIDYGFGALIGATVLAAPVSGGASLALTAALTAAYMAADAVGGWALSKFKSDDDYRPGDGMGQVLGDVLANALGIPKKRGMSGAEGKLWDNKFGSGSAPTVDPEKIMNKLTDKEKEAIARVDGKHVKDDKDKKKISKEFKIGDKTFDLSKSMGGLSRDEYEDLGEKDRKQLDRRLRSYADQNAKENHANIITKGNAENILPLDVTKKVDSISTEASYEQGAGETTIVVKSGSGGDDTVETKGSAEPILVGTGGAIGSGLDEMGDLLYKGG